MDCLSGSRRSAWLGLVLIALVCGASARASVFADVAGVVHDVQHRPIAGADIELRAKGSALVKNARSGADGSFRFQAVPFGEYTVAVRSTGFQSVVEMVSIASGTTPVLHVMLPVATAHETVTVTGDSTQDSGSVTPTVLLSAREIDATPGADRSDSMSMITDYVPGAYMTHDMLHMRGGHQVSWLLDGVEIPNTNIASNLGPQIDPRDAAYLQVDRGSYNADLGDRTYGVFNVNPKSGFERDREGELRMTAGSALSTDDQLSLGDHTERAAYYVSVNGNRTDYGLAPPVETAHHDAANGYGGFASLLFNKDPKDQFRLLAQLRRDYFQIPNDPDASDYENQLYDSSGLLDGQHETDGVLAFTWTHSFSPSTLLAVSPFYHYNSADYSPNRNDTPAATTSDRASQYAGVQASMSGDVAGNHLEAGFYSWGQHDSNSVAVNFNDGSANNIPPQADDVAGGLIEEYVADIYKPLRDVTLSGGLRESYFSGNGFIETATAPRLGVALELPRLHWVFRAFYGRFYQPPPLATLTGGLLTYQQSNGLGFAPLHGERDEEHQFGVMIPWRGWVLDADTFQTEASNFLDHSNIGESSIYIPVTVQNALIQAWELTLKSPPLWQRGHVHLSYSNQIAQQRGPITGGPGCYPLSAPQCGVGWRLTPLDHDQRDTLNVGGDLRLPLALTASTNVYFGSGFSNGYPDAPSPFLGETLPSHTTFDLRLGRSFGERLDVAVNATNVANARTLLDNSLTFGGFHFNDPRQVYGEVRYRFHY
jgi:hypothetical protein